MIYGMFSRYMPITYTLIIKIEVWMKLISVH